MTILWRRAVFDSLREDLLKAAEAAVSLAGTDLKARNKVQVFAQALVDLSVDEFTVHMLQHSLVQLDGPYNALQELVLASLEARIQPLSDPHTFAKMANEELQVAEQLYLPVTCRRVYELLAEKELALLSAHFQALVKSPQWRLLMGSQENPGILNSSFGLFCFNLLNYQKSQAAQFISWLASTELPKIARFNDLSARNDLELLEDEWIERKAKLLFRLPVAVPAALRSTFHDVKRTDLSPAFQACSV